MPICGASIRLVVCALGHRCQGRPYSHVTGSPRFSPTIATLSSRIAAWPIGLVRRAGAEEAMSHPGRA